MSLQKRYSVYGLKVGCDCGGFGGSGRGMGEWSVGQRIVAVMESWTFRTVCNMVKNMGVTMTEGNLNIELESFEN